MDIIHKKKLYEGNFRDISRFLYTVELSHIASIFLTYFNAVYIHQIMHDFNNNVLFIKLKNAFIINRGSRRFQWIQPTSPFISRLANFLLVKSPT